MRAEKRGKRLYVNKRIQVIHTFMCILQVCDSRMMRTALMTNARQLRGPLFSYYDANNNSVRIIYCQTYARNVNSLIWYIFDNI